MRSGDALELSLDDAILEDGGLFGRWQYCRHQTGPSLPTDGLEVCRTFAQSWHPTGRHQRDGGLRQPLRTSHRRSSLGEEIGIHRFHAHRSNDHEIMRHVQLEESLS